MSVVAPVDVENVLRQYVELTRREMERFLPRPGDPDAGLLASLTRQYPNRRAKGIRPALLLATCQAYGGSVHEAVGPAVAIEMLHNAFLIHDDVEDESELRRGQPTLHRTHGVPIAINTGDALTVLALRPLADRSMLGSRLSQLVFDETLRMARQTVAGQALELGWRRQNVINLDPADYFRLVFQKTCCYTTIFPIRIGALIGSRGALDRASMDALSQFGFYLGAAFQIRDDLLNLVGVEHRYGKELRGDLHEGKRTLMLIHLLSAVNDREREWLLGYFGRPLAERTDDEAVRILDLMRHYGSLDFAATWGQAIATAAHTAFRTAFADVRGSTHVDFLQAMIRYMLERSS
jgi:geranylgeranyl diphosphate synthase type II